MSHTERRCELPCATSGLLMAHRWWGGAATRYPGRGGDLARLPVALCWPAPGSLRVPSCVRRACPVCPPPSTVLALSGKEDLPSAPPTHGQPDCGKPGRSRPAWTPPAPVAGWRVGPAGGGPQHTHSGAWGAAFPCGTGRASAAMSCRPRGLSPAAALCPPFLPALSLSLPRPSDGSLSPLLSPSPSPGKQG